MTLGQRLHAARFAKGYKLREVKALTGVSTSFVSDLERNVSSPSIETLRTLAGCYGVSVGSLFGEEKRTMTTLQEAAKQYEEAFQAQSKVVQPFIHEFADRAHLYAAIATAEALTRIADTLTTTTLEGSEFNVAALLLAISRKSQYD